MKKIFIISALLSLLATNGFSAIINVPGNQPTIQSAIETSINGDTILVSDGTYYENLNLLGKEITLASYYLVDNNSTHIDNTRIDGSQAEDPDNASVISLVSGENTATVIFGFTIQNGGGIFPNPEGERSGGGIYCIESEATLISNKIINNFQGVVGNLYGGGIYMFNAELIVDNCLFDNNAATRGGGIYSKNSDLEITYCNFSNNIAIEQAGAIYFANNDNSTVNQTIMVNNCEFYGNNCNETTGGLLVRNDANNGTSVTLEMHNSKFTENASDQRSGMYIKGHNLYYDVYNSVFNYNDANNFAAGVSLSNECTGSFYNCIFNSNNANIGGGSFNSGGVSVWSSADVEFVNCVFADNAASFGSGLTIGGGGIAKAVNSIFWNNSPDQIALTSFDNQGGNLEISYSDLQGGSSQISLSEESELIEGEGIFNINPNFLMGDDNPYSITESSPCIDVGTDYGLTLPQGDIIDNIRIWDGNGDGNAVVDLGAYEFDADPIQGVEEFTQFNSFIFAYPNPASTEISFELRKKNAYVQHYDIIDISGSILHSQKIPAKDISTVLFNVELLKEGVYFCRIISSNNEIIIVKFIVN